MFRTACNLLAAEVRSHVCHAMPRRGRCVSIAALLVSLSALPAAAQTAISADGEVESTSGGFKFPDGTLQTTTAAITDILHLVGEAGEPPFGDGLDADCLWQNPPPEAGLLGTANPVSFIKDADGIVRLAGFAIALPGAGGDATCDDSNPSDLLIFQLPAGYQPEHLEIFISSRNVQGTLGNNLIVPQGGLIIDEAFIPGGTVLIDGFQGESAQVASLDGFTFRAAPPTASPSPAPAKISMQDLYDLLGQR